MHLPHEVEIGEDSNGSLEKMGKIQCSNESLEEGTEGTSSLNDLERQV